MTERLSLCQPYRFIFQFLFKTGLTVRSLIENDPALSGLDRKEVDKAFAQLKKDGAIVSPVRCKWQPAE